MTVLSLTGAFFLLFMVMTSSGPKRWFWTLILVAYVLIVSGFVIAGDGNFSNA